MAESENDYSFYKIGQGNSWNSTSILFYAHHEKGFRRMTLLIGKVKQTHHKSHKSGVVLAPSCPFNFASVKSQQPFRLAQIPFSWLINKGVWLEEHAFLFHQQ